MNDEPKEKTKLEEAKETLEVDKAERLAKFQLAVQELSKQYGVKLEAVITATAL
jgi:hypothetical protein